MEAYKLKITLLLALFLLLALPVQAQSTLSLNTPTEGTVSPGGTSVWTFTAPNSAVLSFALHSNTDGFDPAMTLTDSSGNEIIRSDDYNYPDSLDPLLEAITMPRADVFTLTVYGVNGTSGSYTLTMLPGYSIAAHSDDFTESTWRPTSDVLTAQRTDDQLNMSIGGAQRHGVAFDANAPAFGDFYAQAQVSTVSNPSSGWVVGMALRRVGDSYYLLSISAQGNWRFSLVQDETEQIIRDWTPHPNIVPGASSFTIAAFANGVGFDFFYNAGYIGSSSDTTLTDPGQVGLMLGTFSTQPSQSTATFDNLLITTPTMIGEGRIVPQQITMGDGSATVQTLKRTSLISASGEMAMTIPESSVEYARPGINRVMLARGTQYTNFALGALVTLNAAAPGPAGCGIVFRFTAETNYTLAYFNGDGEFGVSQRTGDTFSPGIFAVNPSVGNGQHHMLVIASGDTVYYYLDRNLIGSMENPAQAGEVGIAVVNFEPNSTACSYSNLWLWKWD